jgi:hemerythrin-like domain-containing protein
MTPTEILEHEHQIILTAIAGIEREVASIRQTGRVDAVFVAKAIDFVVGFADGCHHAKEEKHLFRMLEDRGMSAQQGPLAVMLADHDRGRASVRAAADALPAAAAGDTAAAIVVADSLAAYALLLREHIGKEDGVLYPMANRLLSAADQTALAAAFAQVEKEQAAGGVQEKYHALARELSAR